MASVDLKEGHPLEGSWQVAQVANKREHRSIVGSVQKIWRRLTRPVFGTDQGLPGRVSPERPPTARAQQRIEPPPRPPANENTVKSVKPSPPGKGRLRLLTLDELEALPDPEWLIEGILPQGGLAVLYGEPGAGKSFLALDWALSIATGRPWLGRQVRSGTVIYVYAEGASGLKYRVRAWAEARGGKPGNIRFLPHSLDMRSTGEVAELKKAIGNEGGGPMLIVIDTLARCFGDGDENTPQDMNAFVAGADQLRKAFPGATVLVVHHSGKDPKKRDRGHSALRAAADTVIRLSSNKGRLTLTCEKQKDADAFEKISMRLQQVGLDNGQTSCVIEPSSAAIRGPATGDAGTPDPRSRETDRKALAALASFGQEGAAFTEWQRKSGRVKSTMQAARDRLLAAKLVVQDGQRYRIAQPGPEAGTGPEEAGSAAA